jgi:hypothetical protein
LLSCYVAHYLKRAAYKSRLQNNDDDNPIRMRRNIPRSHPVSRYFARSSRREEDKAMEIFSTRKAATDAVIVDDELSPSRSNDDSLYYTVEEGENSSKPTYQEASGAPVETHSPLGYSVGWVTIVFLNVSKMIGTGVFSTRKGHRW